MIQKQIIPRQIACHKVNKKKVKSVIMKIFTGT
jgi:hypothetical protein